VLFENQTRRWFQYFEGSVTSIYIGITVQNQIVIYQESENFDRVAQPNPDPYNGKGVATHSPTMHIDSNESIACKDWRRDWILMGHVIDQTLCELG